MPACSPHEALRGPHHSKLDPHLGGEPEPESESETGLSVRKTCSIDRLPLSSSATLACSMDRSEAARESLLASSSRSLTCCRARIRFWNSSTCGGIFRFCPQTNRLRQCTGSSMLFNASGAKNGIRPPSISNLDKTRGERLRGAAPCVENSRTR